MNFNRNDAKWENDTRREASSELRISIVYELRITTIFLSSFLVSPSHFASFLSMFTYISHSLQAFSQMIRESTSSVELLLLHCKISMVFRIHSYICK